MENTEALYGFDLRSPAGRTSFSDQHGLFVGAGGNWLAAGLGLQWLSRPALGPRFDSYQKYSFSTAIRPSESLSVGLGAHVFGSATNRQLQGQTGLDLGLQWRPSPYVGFGLALRDVNRPFLRPGRGLPLTALPGVALRFFQGQLVLDQQIAWAASSGALSWTPRLRTEPVPGIGLYARADIPIRSSRGRTDVSLAAVTAGLELSLGRTGIQSAATVHPETSGSKTRVSPLSNTVRLSGRPHSSILPPTGRWVDIDLTSGIAERGSSSLFTPSRRSLRDILLKLEAIETDPSIDGVVVSLGESGLGYAQAWELHQRLDALRSSGTKVAVFLTAPSLNHAYLASAADRIWLPPSAPYTPEGLQATQTHYAEALESIGIEAEFIRIGAYKSSPEQWIETRPSPEDVEQTTAYVDTLYDGLVDGIAEGRSISRDEVEHIVDRVPASPTEAVERGVVDNVIYRDELDIQLREAFGALRLLEPDYDPNPSPSQGWEGRAEIAILYIDGTIIGGSSGEAPLIGSRLTGSETIGRTIDRLIRDHDVRGVVVRVDSPGGSAVASDQIYRDLRRLAQHKPVVASMGDVAASGGYYVAAGADEIYATPHTLTGSIGIFAGKFSAGRLLERLGVAHREIAKRGRVAGRRSLFESWSDAERESIGREIHYLYRLFLHQAARTRPLSADEIDEVARGRVWTGRAADERDLVDEVGGLIDAIRRAEEMAGLEPGGARYRAYPSQGGLLDLPMGTAMAKLVRQVRGDSKSRSLESTALGSWFDRVVRTAALPLIFDAHEPLMLPAQPLRVD
jgi:protease-4